MSGVGQCWDNAPMESFFASLKKELTHHEDYQTRAEAMASIFEYIEVFYNQRRRHTSLGYVCPADYEQDGRGEAKEHRSLPSLPRQRPMELQPRSSRAVCSPAEPVRASDLGIMSVKPTLVQTT
jgi:hypothetical protein